MITLSTGQSIGAKAATAAVINYVLMADALTTSDNFQALAAGQLSTTAAALYTAPASTQALIKTILLNNTSASPVTGVIFYINGLTTINQVVNLTIPANGSATFDGGRWNIFDSNGILQYVGNAGATGATGNTGATGGTGATGAAGRGITSIARTNGNGAAGTTDTYTITYSDSTTSTYTVTNGANGAGGGVVTNTATSIPAVYSNVTVSVVSGTGINNGAVVTISDNTTAFTGIVISGGGTSSLVVRNMGVVLGNIGGNVSSGAYIEGSFLPYPTGGVLDVRAYGAKADGRWVIDASVATSSTSLTSASGLFTAADTGKRFVLVGGGLGGVTMSGTITFVNSTTLTLSTAISYNAGTGLTNAAFLWGTDDTSAWAAAITTLGNMGGTISLAPNPPQSYTGAVVSMVTGLTVNSSGIVIRGTSRPSQQDTGSPTTFRGCMLAYCGTFGGTLLTYQPTSGSGLPALKGCGLSNIALDGCQGLAAVGWYVASVQDLIFENLYFKNFHTAAIDFYTVGTLGEATDITRGLGSTIAIRQLDGPNRQSDGAKFIANTTTNGAVAITSLTGSGTISLTNASAGTVSAGFPTTGTVLISFDQVIQGNTIKHIIPVTYTGNNGIQLTGCTATNPFSSGSSGLNAASGAVALLLGDTAGAVGFRMDANPSSSPAGNPSNTKIINLNIVHQHGVALQMRNTDTMRIDDIFTFRASGGGGIAIDLWGGANQGLSGRNNLFGKISQGSNGSGGMLIRGTESFTFPSQNHVVQFHSRENGEPMPIIGVGATLDYLTSGCPSDTTNRISTLGECVIARLTNSTASIANTETVVLQGRVPLNCFKIGTVVEFCIYGRLTNTTAASTSIVRIRVGTTTLTGAVAASNTIVQGVTARTNASVVFKGAFTITAVGTSGTTIGQIGVTDTGGAAITSTGVTAAVAVNTTLLNLVEFTFISGATTTTFIADSAVLKINV